MDSRDAIDRAIETERNRCELLLDLYRQCFKDKGLEHLWCRIRNQIALGVEPKDADFASQFIDDDQDTEDNT